MPDHVSGADFERRLTEQLTRHAEVARDPRPTHLVAAEAVRLAQSRSPVIPRWDRRLLLVAAVLLVPLALMIAGATLERPTRSGADAIVVLRSADGAVEVVLADGTGDERLLRRLTAAGLGLDPRSHLNDYGSVSQEGWLALGVERPLEGDRYGRTTSYGYVLVDLTDPRRAPFVVHGNGFTGPRWGPNGEFAVYCDYPPDCGTAVVPEPNIGTAAAARVVDPDAGPSSEVVLRQVGLHGGGPEIIWAADGSGLLRRVGTGYGVTPLDGGTPIPGTSQIISRTVRVEGSQLVDVTVLAKRWLGSELAPATLVAKRLSSDGQGLWILRDDPATDTTLLVRMSGPGQIDSIHTFDVPAGTSHGFELAPGDASVVLYVGPGDRPDLMLLPIPEPGAIARQRGVIRGRLAGFVPAAEFGSWPPG